MRLFWVVESNDDSLSNDGADEDNEAARFDTTVEEDMELKAAVRKGVVGVPSSISLAAIQKMA